MKTKCRVTIELSRVLTEGESDLFLGRMDEWLFNEFQDWDDCPFGDVSLSCPILRIAPTEARC